MAQKLEAYVQLHVGRRTRGVVTPAASPGKWGEATGYATYTTTILKGRGAQLLGVHCIEQSTGHTSIAVSHIETVSLSL